MRAKISKADTFTYRGRALRVQLRESQRRRRAKEARPEPVPRRRPSGGLRRLLPHERQRTRTWSALPAHREFGQAVSTWAYGQWTLREW